MKNWRNFEELDYRDTRLGELSLRRRRLPAFGDGDIYEVKLGDEFLMSSLFTDAEVALAQLGLRDLAAAELDVVVGGLGLGYTAAAVLAHDAVRSLLVVEGLKPVIDWHNQELLPTSPTMTADPRCRFIEGDFFELADSDSDGFDPQQPQRRFHAILLDIDHSPAELLNPAHEPFYEVAGLRQLQARLLPGGVYALWSNDPPDAAFLERLDQVFEQVSHKVIRFDNPFQESVASNTVYLAYVG